MADTHFEGSVQFDANVTAKGHVGAQGRLRVKADIADFTDGGALSGTLEIGDIPENCLVVGIAHRPLQAVGGGDNTTAVIDLGDGSNADRFIDNADVATASSTWVREAPSAFGDGADIAGLPLQVDTAITLTVTVTVDNDFSTATGLLEFEVVYLRAGMTD